jgi:hypothetical protein
MERGYYVLLFFYIPMIFAPNIAHAMNIFPGSKNCYCMLLKRVDDGSFYIRINSLDGPLFEYEKTDDNPFKPITTDALFPEKQLFVFDSRKMPEYINAIEVLGSTESKKAAIKATIEKKISTYTWAVRGLKKNVLRHAPIDPVQELDAALRQFLNTVHILIIQKIKLYDNFKTGLSQLLNDELLALVQKKDRSLFPSTTINSAANYLSSFIKDNAIGAFVNAPKNSNLDPDVKKFLETYRVDIQKIWDTVLSGQLNYITDLSQDNLMSRPFRIIYYEIQKLGAACNVNVAPIDSLATSAFNKVNNKYTTTLVGAGMLGLLWSKLGRPTLNWPATGAQ